MMIRTATMDDLAAIRFTMIVSISTTIFVRLVFSYLLGLTFDLGVIGIAWAMVMNWIANAIFFATRVKSGKWKAFKVI